jgi:hypothetical protein
VSRLVCMKEVDYTYSEIDTTMVNQISQPGQSVLGFATVSVLPAVLPKWVMWVWVQLPNLDTTHNRVPLPQYCRYKRVFQPTIFGQQN